MMRNPRPEEEKINTDIRNRFWLKKWLHYTAIKDIINLLKWEKETKELKIEYLSRSYIKRFVRYNLHDSTSLTVWNSEFIQTWCTNICMIQLLKNKMSSICYNLDEGSKPITFQVLQCWIILKKNLVWWNELKSGKNITSFCGK